jgi:murein DD-endopeptidase MepM/ murein hydrolase activator NlpD
MTNITNSFFLLISLLIMLGLSNLSYAASIEIKGSLQQGSLLIGKVPQGHQVIYQQKKLKLTSNGQFLLGLGRNAPNQIEITVIKPNSQTVIKVFPIATREYNIQRIEGVPKKTVTPSEADLQRIRSDVVLVKNARREVTDRIDFLLGFKEPDIGPITGVYGSQRFYNGVPKNPHYGIDYAAPTGTLVKAPSGGVVTLAHNDLFYSGGTLIIDHGHGLSSTFLHLSEIDVELGQIVDPDQVIGKVGSTGRSTGPHLDWRMNWRDQRIDPKLVLESLPRAN